MTDITNHKRIDVPQDRNIGKSEMPGPGKNNSAKADDTMAR